MADWVIRHTPVVGEPLYWEGNRGKPLSTPMGMTMSGDKGTMFGPLAGAARFVSEDAALSAFRGDYRPADSCCQAVKGVTTSFSAAHVGGCPLSASEPNGGLCLCDELRGLRVHKPALIPAARAHSPHCRYYGRCWCYMEPLKDRERATP